MVKKRRAEEQVSGVPVNKRKSLLMKPRHYSPNMDCKERDTRTEAEEDNGLLETNKQPTTGSKEECPKLFICPGTKDSALIYVEPIVCVVQTIFQFGNKPNT